MALTAWPRPNRATRCAQCQKKLWRYAAYVERVNGKVVALCAQHARRGQGGTA